MCALSHCVEMILIWKMGVSKWCSKQRFNSNKIYQCRLTYWHFFQPDDDDLPLLNTLGLLLFWTQFGLGLGLFVCLAVAVGLLIWCRKKNKQRPAPRIDPELPQPDPRPEQKPEEDRRTERSLAISNPINTLNLAKDETDSNSNEESIYNEPTDEMSPEQQNPFEGWTVPSSFRPIGPPPPPPTSSFRPIGPPPPPPPEKIPMVVRPVAKKDKSTMTDCPKSKRTLSKANGTTKARSDIKSGYMASPDSSWERSSCRMTGARPKQQQTNSWKQSQHPLEPEVDDGPTYNLPLLPTRSSSLRHKRKKPNVTNTATTMC